jgi:predicted porin
MKKSLLALAALTAFAGVASAQSSVTLFGIVDLNLRNVKNGSTSLKSMSTDGINSSRLGFRGVEDLGGGLRAGFWLEGALAPDVGTSGGQTWQRRSTVSLMGGFGEIRLGRDYTPTFWNHTIFDPFGTNGIGAQTNLQTQLGQTSMLSGGATTLVRANNSIGYFLPSMGGLYGQVMVAAGEGVAGNKYVGGRLGYAAGPINVAFAYGKTEINSTDDQVGLNLGLSWNLGFMTLFGQYHKYELDRTGSGKTNDPEQTNLMVAASFPFGASSLRFSYGRVEVDNLAGSSAQKASQVALGYQYDLSKRTALYAAYSRISNDTRVRFAVAGAPAFGGTASKPSSTGYEFGVRHSF